MIGDPVLRTDYSERILVDVSGKNPSRRLGLRRPLDLPARLASCSIALLDKRI